MEIMTAPPLHRFSEFFLDNQGVRLFGTCGPTAFASAAGSALGNECSPLGVYNTMRAHGWCDPGGACTIGGILNIAAQYHIPVAAFAPFNNGWTGFISWIEDQVSQGNPVVVEVAAGQALVDALTGAHENAVNLQYHYIAILGLHSGGVSPQAGGRNLLPGWWCADGDNFAGGNSNANAFRAANVLQYYSDSVLAAARPCAAVALKGRPVKMAWIKEANGSGRDDKGHTCGAGFMAALQSSGDAAYDGLLSETVYQGAQTFLPLANGAIYHWDGSAVHTSQGAQVLADVWAQLEATRAALVAAEKQIAAKPAGSPTAAPAAPAVDYQAKYEKLRADAGKIEADLTAALAAA